MRTSLISVLALLLYQLPTGTPPPSAPMKADVERLVKAAEQLTGTWASQAPPAIPEVTSVARHGKPVVPLIMALLSDDPDAERDRKRWTVQQQAALALARIYSEPTHCGRVYCDGDPRERIGHVKRGWRARIAADSSMTALDVAELLDRFKNEPDFSRQLEIARALAAAAGADAIRALEPWLTHEDRHLRGNAAFVLARLGDPRGFPAIAEILSDRSARPPGQGTHGARWSLQAQIRADRYYAAHLLGDLKDVRGVALLVPLLEDPDVGSVAPWALAEIGDRRAVGPLIEMLSRDAPTTRMLAILALETLNVREALPRLRELLRDDRRANFGEQLTVAEAARRAIATLSSER